MEKLNLLFIGLSSLFAFLAFAFSLYTFYKVNPPVEVIIDEKLHFLNGEIGYYNDSMEFINVLDGYNSPVSNIYFLSIRIINSRNYPVSIFDITLVDENDNTISYHKGCNIPYYSKIPKLIIKTSSTSIGLNLPYSHYHTLQPGTFSHLDIAIPLDEIQNYGSKKITLFFRLSTRTVLHSKSKLIRSNINLKFKVHCKNFYIE